MRMIDIIELKKNKQALTSEQMHYVIDGYCKGSIPDYQMSAFLMTIYFNGLTDLEVMDLTREMIASGKVIDLSAINGIVVDKHSTGGVGDKTTLVLAPLVAACDVFVAKMSGRGLGHTGGTIDKLESIDGFDVNLKEDEFIEQVNKIHLALIGQSEQLALADKKIYALRDVTGSVDCMELIASSIMSKKIASGSDAILLDVKYGNGAFMKNIDEAKRLGKMMIAIGQHFNKDTRVIISSMQQPLGLAIGNSLEVKEAIATLKGEGPADLLSLCMKMASIMLIQAKRCQNEQEAMKLLKNVLDNGLALAKFKEMVKFQHGNVLMIDNPDLFKKAKLVKPIIACDDGYVKYIDAKGLGNVVMKLGGGRQKKDDPIDHSVGIVLNKKIGDYCQKGDILAYVHANDVFDDELLIEVIEAYQIVDSFVEKVILIDQILV